MEIRSTDRKYMKTNFKISTLLLIAACFAPRPIYAEGFGVPDPRGSGNFQLRSMIWSPISTGYDNYDRYFVVGRVWSGTQFLGFISSYRASDGGQDGDFALGGGFGYGNSNPSVINPFSPKRNFDITNAGKIFEFGFAHTTGNAYGYDNLCTSVIEADTTNHYYIAGCRAMLNSTFYNVYLVSFDQYGNLRTGFGTNGIKDTGWGGVTTHAFIRGLTIFSSTLVTAVGSVGTYTGNNMQPKVAKYNITTGVETVFSAGSNPVCSGTGYQALGTNVTPTSIFYDSNDTVYIAPVVDWKYAANGTRRAWHHVYNSTNLDEVCARTSGDTHPFFGNAATHTGTWASYNDVVLVGQDLNRQSTTSISYYAGAARINDGTTPGAYSCMVGYVGPDGKTPSASWGKFLLTTTNATSADGIGITLFNPQTNNGRPTRDCILNSVQVRESAVTVPADVRQYVAGAVYNGSNYDFLVGSVGKLGSTIRSLSYGMEGPENDVANRVQFFSTAGTLATHENFYAIGRAAGSLATTTTQFAQAHSLKVENKESWIGTDTNSGQLPAARQDHVAVWTGSKMLVWGGLSANGAIYDPVADTWIAMATASQPTFRSGATALWKGSAMILWGGYDGTTYFQDGQKLTISAASPAGVWSTLATANQPSGRTEQASAVVTHTDGKVHLVIWGGKTGAAAYTNTGSDYNVDDNLWTLLPATTMVARSGAAGTGYYGASGPAALFWGGWNGTTYYSDGTPYLITTGAWGTTFTNGTAANFAKMNYDHNRKILRYGGYSGSAYQEGFYMDPLSSLGTWTAMNASGSVGGRKNHVQLWNGSKLFVWGGNNGGVIAAGGLYDPRDDTWSAITASGGAAARELASGVWTGERMVVWGGNSAGNLASGGQYSPSTTIYHPSRNVWTTTQTSTPPAARMSQSTVWTGKHMIVWGGLDTAGAPVGTGSRYDPVADTWTATAVDATNAVARSEHTALWAGTEMVVWGGKDAAAAAMATGGIYNPSADTWSAVATLNAPSARFAHRAVWAFTGTDTPTEKSKMVILAGEGTSPQYKTDGGIYDLAAHTWAVSGGGIAFPTGRRNPVVWWDGHYVGMWGGRDAGPLTTGRLFDAAAGTSVAMTLRTGSPVGFTNGVWTGKYVVFLDVAGEVGTTSSACPVTASDRAAKFDPFTGVGGTWSTVSTTSIPVCRVGGSYVWTGSKLLVYGGVNSVGTILSGGGLYDPEYDVWASVATNANADKYMPSAIWDGKEAIIWGGSTTVNAVNATTTIGRYQR